MKAHLLDLKNLPKNVILENYPLLMGEELRAWFNHNADDIWDEPLGKAFIAHLRICSKDISRMAILIDKDNEYEFPDTKQIQIDEHVATAWRKA